MVMRGMAHRRIGVGATPGQDRGAIDDEVAPADKALLACAAHQRDQEALARRRAWRLLRRHCWEALGTQRRPCALVGSPQATANAGQTTSQSCKS
jgi:hypothetical protein